MSLKIDRRRFLKIVSNTAFITTVSCFLTGCNEGSSSPKSSGSVGIFSSNSESIDSESEISGREIVWKISQKDDNSVLIVGYEGGQPEPAGKIVIPTEVFGYTINGLSGALSGADKVTDVVVPEGIKSIAGDFDKCTSLKSVSLPESLKSIGWVTFRSTPNLKGIIIPESVESIGANAFYESGIETIVIPTSVTYLGLAPFMNCKNLKEAEINGNLTSWEEESAFEGCTNLKRITFGGTAPEIPQRAFYNCSNLQEIQLPEGLETIHNNAFCGCSSLKKIILPDTVTTVGYEAFSGCSALQSFAFPEGVEKIAESTFADCINLESIYIPKSLSLIYGNAFTNCKKLKKVFYEGDPLEWRKINGGVIPSSIDDIEHVYQVSYADFLAKQ